VLEEKVNHIGIEPRQALVAGFNDIFGPPISAAAKITELGSQEGLVALSR
jgi:hypothetical protein